MSGFVIVHRYAYVLLPLEGDPSIVFPREARYVGEHGTTWIDEQVFVDRPGEWLADRVRGQRVGVYGLDYVMTVRDYRALAGAAELVPGTSSFDHARAVKSELELESVRDSVRINTEGFWIFLDALRAGEDASGDPRPVRALLRRAGLRPADDGHGARRRERRGAARVPDRRRAARSARATRAAVARDRRPRRPLGRGLARDLRRRAERRDEADDGGLRGVLRGGARRRSATARRRTTSTAPSRRGSSTAASSSATSPATRSG